MLIDINIVSLIVVMKVVVIMLIVLCRWWSKMVW